VITVGDGVGSAAWGDLETPIPLWMTAEPHRLVPFAVITDADVRRAGDPGRGGLRHRAAHAGPTDDGTLLHRMEFHPV